MDVLEEKEQEEEEDNSLKSFENPSLPFTKEILKNQEKLLNNQKKLKKSFASLSNKVDKFFGLIYHKLSGKSSSSSTSS